MWYTNLPTEAFQNIGIIATAIAAALGALTAIWKLIVKPTALKIKETFALLERLSKAAQELYPNGSSSLRDAVDRIEARQLLQEQRTKALLAEVDFGVFEADLHGNITWISDALRRVAGGTIADHQGMGWLNSIHPNDRARVYEDWVAAIEQERNFISEHHIVNLENGRVTTVEVKATKIICAVGKPIGWIGTVSTEKSH